MKKAHIIFEGRRSTSTDEITMKAAAASIRISSVMLSNSVRGWTFAVTDTSRSLLPRRTTKSARVPSAAPLKPVSKYRRDSIGIAAMSKRSPFRIPARSAGRPGWTPMTLPAPSNCIPNPENGCQG